MRYWGFNICNFQVAAQYCAHEASNLEYLQTEPDWLKGNSSLVHFDCSFYIFFMS